MEGEVRVSGLNKSFGATGFLSRWRMSVPVLQDITFSLARGELVAMVGESGSGKTTLGRTILGLVPFDSGEVTVNGFNVGSIRRSEEKAFRMSAQMVFQNPYSSINPAFRARETVLEAIRVHGGKMGKERAESEVERLMGLVQLPVERLNEYSPQLSGGEKRRVVFARALATNPRFVVMDEPVSGLDQPIQAQLLDLLRKIHIRQHTTMLFISHDLRLVRFIATRVIVLHRGRIVEDAPTEAFFSRKPAHPYSVELIDSAFRGDLRNLNTASSKPPARGSAGCSFRHRCRVFCERGMPECSVQTPKLIEISPGHRVACHAVLEGNR